MLEDLDELTLIQTVKTFPAFMQSEISKNRTFFCNLIKEKFVKWRCVEGVNITPLFLKLSTSLRLLVNLLS